MINFLPDLMFEREQLKAQIKKWKWLFVIALFLFFLAINKSNASKDFSKEHIVRINIKGVINHEPELIEKLQKIEKEPKIKALLIHIDSPGGTSFASEDLYINLKKIAKNKPVVAILETVAASGGYMVALASDYIVARNMTLTGSVGVIWQSFEAVEFANKLGIKFVSFKSSALKASPNPMEVVSPEAHKAVMETIDDSYDVFLQMLMDSRKMKKEQAMKLADGRIYTGRRAKELNLIDTIGGEEEALKWLEAEKKISKNLPIENVELTKPGSLLEELSRFFHESRSMMSGWWNTSFTIAK